MVYYYSYLFFLGFGLECLSADSSDLFADGELVMADASFFNSPGDASVPASNGADEALLLATSPGDWLDGQAIDQSSLADSYISSDPNAPAALPPSLLSLDDDSTSSPSQFHDTAPGEDDAPECWSPKLAVCCDGRYNRENCVWFSWDIKICRNDANIRCCEQVLPSGEAVNCDWEFKRWPGVIRGFILDILRTPVPLPETIPLGGFLSPSE